MNYDLDCTICFGTGTLVKTTESTCPDCESNPTAHCKSCRGFGLVRLQNAISCHFCPDHSNHKPQQIDAEWLTPQSVQSDRRGRVTSNELAMLLALASATVSSLILLVNSSQVGVVMVLFTLVFLGLYKSFKKLIRNAIENKQRVSSLLMGGVLSTATSVLPMMFGLV